MTDKIKPIKPSDFKDKGLPDFVVRAVNEVIEENYSRSSFTFTQIELVNKILRYAPDGTSREKVFKKKWCDIEEYYREAGWKVSYDSPCLDTNFDAYYKFEGE